MEDELIDLIHQREDVIDKIDREMTIYLKADDLSYHDSVNELRMLKILIDQVQQLTQQIALNVVNQYRDELVANSLLIAKQREEIFALKDKLDKKK